MGETIYDILGTKRTERTPLEENRGAGRPDGCGSISISASQNNLYTSSASTTPSFSSSTNLATLCRVPTFHLADPQISGLPSTGGLIAYPAAQAEQYITPHYYWHHMSQSLPQTPYEALVLGVAQDGGVPHMACSCRNCIAAASDPQCAVSLALIHHPPQGSAPEPPPSEAWLIDCGPDIKRQWQMLQDHAGPKGCRIRGVFLTHLHMGHYIGLFQFGKEAAQARGLKLYCTASVAAFLGRNEPWRYYLDQGIFELEIIQPGEATNVAQGLSVTPLLVPHR